MDEHPRDIFPLVLRLVDPYPAGSRTHRLSSQRQQVTFAFVTASYSLSRARKLLRDLMPRDIRARQRVSQACVPCGQRKTKVSLASLHTSGEAPFLPSASAMVVYQYATNARTVLGSATMAFRNGTRRKANLYASLYSSTDRTACRRRSSIILGERVNLTSHRQPIEQNAGQNNPGSLASTGDWTRSEEEASSILANLSGSRRSSSRQNDITATSVSSAVSTRLFTAYFANIHTIWPILYMPMHDYGSGNLHSDAFAPAVLYAVYAIAACVEPASASSSTTLEDKTPPSAVFFEGKDL